jgi:hypothetical protein
LKVEVESQAKAVKNRSASAEQQQNKNPESNFPLYDRQLPQSVHERTTETFHSTKNRETIRILDPDLCSRSASKAHFTKSVLKGRLRCQKRCVSFFLPANFC